MSPQQALPPPPADKNGTEILKTIITILVPVVGIIIAYYAGRADLDTRLRVLEATYSASSRQTTQQMGRLEERLSSHVAIGSGGVPHPQGVILDIRTLTRRVQDLEKQLEKQVEKPK